MGAPGLRAGPASRAVLSAIDPNAAHGHALMPPLIAFLRAREAHKADSETIVAAFRSRVPPHELAVFRQLLRKVAEFDPRNKMWTLMEDFK